MAGNWIKMRSDLFTHPKVVRISSSLQADRLKTVGGLMSVWCLFDAHSEDGRLEGYTFETVDELIGWQGFSRAMNSVGWLDEDSEGLVLPEFDTHNGQSAKKRAQNTDRKRAGRLSSSEEDKNVTREEKRREEKKEEEKPKTQRAPRFDAQAHLVSRGVDPQVADDWLKLRKDRRLTPTATALEGIEAQAAEARMTLEAVIRLCCNKGWGGFEASWLTRDSPRGTPAKQSRHNGFDQIDYREGVAPDGTF
ncbi:DNA replication domain protein [Burkholderia sp. ISTR5]|uniref:DNA replication domain protein n=1 Tax=Burkholderia sp. ISTR5 TaxID=2500161 RepID=UPI00136C8D7A|nr:DNA replication domain protein [Burkholderia sp. ISTR5]NBI44958.1 DNA replication domain protein [Burkholderia sp. ISTR5]